MDSVVQPEASVVQTGLDIRYVGEHAFAYSGLFAASATAETALDFTTGSGYIVAELQLNAAVDDDSGSMKGAFSVLTFNGVNVAVLITANSANDAPGSVRQSLIIPPFTHVVATIDMEGAGADEYGSITLVGRVYGAK
jgi:hypothetical protein